MEWRLLYVPAISRKTRNQEDLDDPREGGEDDNADEDLEIEMH